MCPHLAVFAVRGSGRVQELVVTVQRTIPFLHTPGLPLYICQMETALGRSFRVLE